MAGGRHATDCLGPFERLEAASNTQQRVTAQFAQIDGWLLALGAPSRCDAGTGPSTTVRIQVVSSPFLPSPGCKPPSSMGFPGSERWSAERRRYCSSGVGSLAQTLCPSQLRPAGLFEPVHADIAADAILAGGATIPYCVLFPVRSRPGSIPFKARSPGAHRRFLSCCLTQYRTKGSSPTGLPTVEPKGTVPSGSRRYLEPPNPTHTLSTTNKCARPSSVLSWRHTREQQSAASEATG